MTRLLLTFTFDARARWDRSPEWRAAERDRAASGSTSLRVSKAASKALSELGERIRAAIPDKEKSKWHRDRITPDELIAALAAGLVVFPVDVPPAARPPADPRQLALPVDVPPAASNGARRAAVHASRDPRAPACKGIPVHAKTSAAAAACKSGDRQKVHAKHDRTTHAKPDVGTKRRKSTAAARSTTRAKGKKK